MPPIDVYRIGDLHFVKDGHHRVSVANALGYEDINANVTEIRTRVPAQGLSKHGDIVTKDYERIFRSRVPLPAELTDRLKVSDPWGYAELAENVEAWGFRLTQKEGRFISREDVALQWFRDEFEPVVEMLGEAGLIEEGTEADAYLRFAGERYRLLRAHEWTDEVIQRLRGPRRRR
jgi:hypothetical protein